MSSSDFCAYYMGEEVRFTCTTQTQQQSSKAPATGTAQPARPPCCRTQHASDVGDVTCLPAQKGCSNLKPTPHFLFSEPSSAPFRMGCGPLTSSWQLHNSPTLFCSTPSSSRRQSPWAQHRTLGNSSCCGMASGIRGEHQPTNPELGGRTENGIAQQERKLWYFAFHPKNSTIILSTLSRKVSQHLFL